MATNVNNLFGANFAENPYSLPNFTMSIATPEAGITGWNADNTDFHIRVYDNLMLEFSLPTAASVSVKIWTENDNLMNHTRLDCESGPQRVSILMDPEQYDAITPGVDASNVHTGRNFLPGQKYSVQVFAYAHSSFPIVLGYSEMFDFSVIKGKSQIVFENVDGYDRGMFCDDHMLDPLDSYVDYHFSGTLVDALHPATKIAGETIEISTMNPKTESFDLMVSETTDTSGTFNFVNRQFEKNTSLAQFKFSGSKYYEGTVTTDQLDPNHIQGLPYDYSAPDEEETSEMDQKTSASGTTAIQSLTELQRTYSWADTSSLFGFLTMENTFQNPFPNIGVSENLSALYIGTTSTFSGSIVFLSPAIRYYNDEVSWANLTLLFSTMFEQNRLADDLTNAAITVNIHLYDGLLGLLQTVPFYSGIGTEFRAKTISFDSQHFTKPQTFHIGISVEIVTGSPKTSSDILDELYFSIREFDFHVKFASPTAPLVAADEDDVSVGYFISPTAPTIFAAESILLTVHCPVEENYTNAQIVKVEFFMRRADGSNQTLGTTFTASSLNVNGSEDWSWIFENLNEYRGFAHFGAIITDKGGNILVIFSPLCEIAPYSLSVADYANILQITPGVDISGSIEDYFDLYEGDPVALNVTISLLVDTGGENDLVIGSDSVVNTETGLYTINWQDQFPSLPQELVDIKVPINFLQYSSATTGIRTQTNLASWGRFTDPNYYSISFVTCADGTANDWRVDFFELDTSSGDSLYNWNHIEMGSYDIGVQESALQIQPWNWNGEVDDQDELVIFTASALILFSMVDGIWIAQRWSFASLGISDIHQIYAAGSSLFAVSNRTIYEFSKESLTLDTYDTAIDLGSHGDALGLTYGEIAFLSLPAQSNIVVTTEKEVLAWNGNDWEVVFTSLFPIMDKVVIDQLDATLAQEILFMVRTPEYVTEDFIEIIRASWDSAKWTFVSTGNYGEIAQVYDFKTGHLAADNFGRVIVARNDDVRIDGLLAPLSTIIYDLHEVISPTVVSDLQAGYLINLDTISYTELIRMQRSRQITEFSTSTTQATAYHLQQDPTDLTLNISRVYAQWAEDYINDPAKPDLWNKLASTQVTSNQSTSRLISPFTSNVQYSNFPEETQPTSSDFGLTDQGHLLSEFTQFDVERQDTYLKQDLRGFFSDGYWDLSRSILYDPTIKSQIMSQGTTVPFVERNQAQRVEALNYQGYSYTASYPWLQWPSISYTGFSTDHFSDSTFGYNFEDVFYPSSETDEMLFLYEQPAFYDDGGDQVVLPESEFETEAMEVLIPFDFNQEILDTAATNGINLVFSIAPFYEALMTYNFKYTGPYYHHDKSVFRANYKISLVWGSSELDIYSDAWGMPGGIVENYEAHRTPIVQYGFDGRRMGRDLVSDNDAWTSATRPLDLSTISSTDTPYFKITAYTPKTAYEIDYLEPRESGGMFRTISQYHAQQNPSEVLDQKKNAIVARFLFIKDFHLELNVDGTFDSFPVADISQFEKIPGEIPETNVYTNGNDANDVWENDYLSIKPDSLGNLYTGQQISDFESIFVTLDIDTISKFWMADGAMRTGAFECFSTMAETNPISNGDYMASFYQSIRPGITDIDIEFYNGDTHLDSNYDFNISEAACFADWIDGTAPYDRIYHTFTIDIPEGLPLATEIRLKINFDWQLNWKIKRIDSSRSCSPQLIMSMTSREITAFNVSVAGSLRKTPYPSDTKNAFYRTVRTGIDFNVTIEDNNSLDLFERLNITIPYEFSLKKYNIFTNTYSGDLNTAVSGDLDFIVQYYDPISEKWVSMNDVLVAHDGERNEISITMTEVIYNAAKQSLGEARRLQFRIIGAYTFSNYSVMATYSGDHVDAWNVKYQEILVNENQLHAKSMSILTIDEMVPIWEDQINEYLDLAEYYWAIYEETYSRSAKFLAEQAEDNAWKLKYITIPNAVENRAQYAIDIANLESEIGLNTGDYATSTGKWKEYYAVEPQGDYLNQTLVFEPASQILTVKPRHELKSDCPTDSTLLFEMTTEIEYSSESEFNISAPKSYEEMLTSSFRLAVSNYGELNVLIAAGKIITLPIDFRINELDRGHLSPAAFTASIAYLSNVYSTDSSGVISLTFNSTHLVPAFLEVTLASNFTVFESLSSYRREYTLSLSLRGNDLNWFSSESLLQLMDLPFSIAPQTTLIQDFNGGFNEVWGTMEASFHINVGNVSEDYSSISHLEFELPASSTIDEWVWDSTEADYVPRNLFDASERGNWNTYTGGTSLIQIKKEDEWVELMQTPNPDQSLRFSIFFDELNGIDSYRIGDILEFRIILNTTNYLEAMTTYNSNYMEINIPQIDLLFSKDNNPEQTGNNETYTQTLEVAFDPATLDVSSDSLEFYFTETITVQAKTASDLCVDFAGGLIVGAFPTAISSVSNGNHLLSYGTTVCSGFLIDEPGATTDRYEITCIGTFSFYSMDQLFAFLDAYDEVDNLTLRIEVNWQLQNNYMYPVHFMINSSMETKVTETQWDRVSETVYAATHTLDVFDLDQDGDFDLLLDDGSALLFQTNTGIFPLILRATDGNGNLICERNFWGILDVGTPHPEFILDDDHCESTCLPEFNQNMTITILDFSPDLVHLDLFWSTDGVFYEPGDVEYNVTIHIFGRDSALPDPINDFFYPISVDTSNFKEGIIYLKIVGTDSSGNHGVQFLTFLYDTTAPVTLVSYSATDNSTVSLTSNILFEFQDTNSLQNLTILVENAAHDILFGQYTFGADQLTENSLTLNILDDFITKFGLSASTFGLTVFVTDKAGNCELPMRFEIVLNQKYAINYFLDESYEMAAPANMEVYYEDVLFGIITDSIGSALPAGYEFEIRMNDLVYAYITLEGSEGKFEHMIQSTNLYSTDLRTFPTTTMTTNINDSSNITDRHVQLAADGMPQTVNTQGISSFFIQQVASPVLIYKDLDLTFTTTPSFEGIIIDLFIPWSFDALTGSSFKEIEIFFISESENESLEDKVWTYTLDRDFISELFLQNLKPIVWGSMLVSHIPVAISWAVLFLSDPTFNLAEIDQIAIKGINNDIHPCFSNVDPTLSMQALVCGGIRLVDFLNDATIYHEENPEGSEIHYTNFEGKFRTNALIDINIAIPYTITIRHSQFTSVTTDSLTDVVAYSDEITVSGIKFDNEVFPEISHLVSEFLYLSVTHPTQDIVGIPVKDGIPEEMAFTIIGRPDVDYRFLQLGFSGNALFTAGAFTINATFIIPKEEVVLDMFVTELGSILDYSIVYGEKSSVGGQIIDNDENLMVYHKNITEKIATPFYQYLNGKWVWEKTEELSPYDLVIGVKVSKEEYYWFEKSSANGSMFQFLLDNSPDGNFPLYPQTISCAIRFLGNDFYEAKTQVVVVTIDPLTSVISIADSSADLDKDLGSIIDGRITDTTMTYSDDLTYSFLLEDAALDGQPIVDVPVWLQVGMVPRSPDFPSEFEDPTLGVPGQYLVGFDIPVPIEQMVIQQSDFDIPVVYPFVDQFDGDVIKGYVPLYYQTAQTNKDGVVEFRVDGKILTDIITEYYRKVNDGGTLETSYLYVRVFYSREYSGADMALPSTFIAGAESYDVDFGHTKEFVYSDTDPELDNYCNPKYSSVMAEGMIYLRKDDLIFQGGQLEINTPEGFWSGIKIVEADYSGDIENGYTYLPEPLDNENWLATEGIKAGDEFWVKMAVYDTADDFAITDGRLYGESYEEFTQYADVEADFLFYHGYETYGNQFERFIPGTYNIHYDIDPFGTDSFYYNVPEPIVTGLLIKSPYSYSIDHATHLYSLPNLLSTDPQTQVSFDNSTDYWTRTPYETNYPTLTADLSIRNLTQYIPNYNHTDMITVQFQVNGYTYDMEFTTNTTPYIDEDYGTYHLGADYTFEVPLKFMDSLRPNITIDTFFDFDPTMNLNWTLEQETYIGTHIDSEGIVNWTDWYETVEGGLVNKSYAEYEMGARYEVIVENMTIWETKLRDDGQSWQFSNEFGTGDPQDEYFWTYLNGTKEQKVLSKFQIEDKMGLHGDWDYDGDGTNETFFVNEQTYNRLSITIGDPAFDSVSYWDDSEIELMENITFNANTTIYSLLTVEEWQWNSIIEIHDNFHRETYQSIDGFVLPVDTLSGECSIWNHSVRSGSYDTSIAATIPRDAVQIGLFAGESIEIYRDQVYMPYNSSMQWSFRIPNFENIDLSSLNVNVSLSLESATNLDKISWSSHSTNPIYLNLGTCDLEENVLILKDAGFAIPEEYWGRWATMTINVTVLSAPENELISIALLDGWIDGHENIIQISNAFPKSLRAKLFSSNFIYLYTQQALTPSVGADRAQYEWNNILVDDIYYELEASNDLHSGNLMDVADVWDWEVFYSDFDRYNQVETWTYDEETNKYAQLEELFDNPKKGTYAEFALSDKFGTSMGKIMLDDTFLSELDDFAKYSCFVNLYDVDYDEDSRVLDRLLAKHKLTIMVQPVEWISQTQRTIINSDTGGNTYSTNIQDRNINMSYVENVTNQVALSYFMPGQSNDVMITNWQSPMEHFDAPAMDALSTLEEKMFYDVNQYSNYFDLLVWDGDIGIPEYDGSDIGAALSPEASITDIFTINIEGLYNDPTGFAYVNLPFGISNTSNIESVRIGLHSVDQGRILDEVSLEGSSEQFFEDGFYDLHEQFGRSLQPTEIRFYITYKDEITLSKEPPIFYLMGLGLYHTDSVATLEILINQDSNSGEEFEVFEEFEELLYPTIWNSEMAPLTHRFEFNMTEDTESKILSSIKITTPNAPNTEMTLYSFSMGHYDINTTYTEAVYSYNFDPHQVWFETFLMSFYVPDIAYAPWTTTQAAPIIRDNDWTYTVTYDFEGDMSYDLRIQWFDGEKKGDEIFETLEDGTNITYFQNGIKDTVLWDFGVDGNWNIMQKWDDIISVYNITELDAYDTDYHYISQSQYQYYEEAHDFTGDGIYNMITRVFRSRSFEQFYEVETETGTDIRRRTSIPNYRENFVRDGEFKHYFRDNTSTTEWTAWVNGFSVSNDLDGDGIFEETVEQKNLFADSFTDLMENHVERIYETYTYTRSWEEVIRNTSDYTQILDVRLITETEQSNVLLEHDTFLLLGADSSKKWRTTGQDDNNITGKFVFEYDVPVVIDPRIRVPYSMRVDEHGILAWFDSQDDDFYEMAFIFTEESWKDGIAIGVYLSQSGRSEVITDPTLFRLSGDDVIPTHWLSQDYDYEDIMAVSWDNAWNEFVDQLSNPEFLLMMGIDTLSTAAIMMGTSALMSGLTALSVASACVPIVGAIFMAGSFLAYQFWLRPIIEDTLSFFGVVADKGREIGKDADHPLVDVLSLDLSYGWQSLSDDATLFQAKEIVPTYTENIYFMDINPFESDSGDLGPGAESWFDWVGWNEDNVYAQYQVPQFWEPQPPEGYYGGELLYDLDIFAALEKLNLFNPEYTESDYLDYQLNLDELSDLNDIPHDIDLGGSSYWDSGAGWIINPTAFVHDLKINGEAHIYAAEHNYYELYPELTPASPVEDVLKQIWWDRMYNQEAYQRRAFHQYFYRTPTNATWDLWDRADPQYERYAPLDEIGRVTSQIADNSIAGYAAVEYATGENGQPMLIATYETTMNYTNPVVEEVDYHIMCLISKYRTGYISGTDYNMDIFLINLGIQAIQTAIGIAAGFAGSGIGTALRTSTGKWSSIQEAFRKSSFVGEMMEEMVKEALWAETAKFVGVGDLLAEQFGEFMGGFGVVQHITGVSLKDGLVDGATIKQYIKQRQRIRQYGSNTRSIITGLRSGLNLGELALLSHDPSMVVTSESSVKPFSKEDEVLLAQALSGKTDHLGEMVDRIQELVIWGVVSGRINLATARSHLDTIMASETRKFDNIQVSERILRMTERTLLAVDTFAGGNNLHSLTNSLVMKTLGGVYDGRYMYHHFWSKDGRTCDITDKGEVTFYQDGVQQGESFNIYDPRAGSDMLKTTDLLDMFDGHMLIDPKRENQKVSLKWESLNRYTNPDTTAKSAEIMAALFRRDYLVKPSTPVFARRFTAPDLPPPLTSPGALSVFRDASGSISLEEYTKALDNTFVKIHGNDAKAYYHTSFSLPGMSKKYYVMRKYLTDKFGLDSKKPSDLMSSRVNMELAYWEKIAHDLDDSSDFKTDASIPLLFVIDMEFYCKYTKLDNSASYSTLRINKDGRGVRNFIWNQIYGNRYAGAIEELPNVITRHDGRYDETTNLGSEWLNVLQIVLTAGTKTTSGIADHRVEDLKGRWITQYYNARPSVIITERMTDRLSDPVLHADEWTIMVRSTLTLKKSLELIDGQSILDEVVNEIDPTGIIRRELGHSPDLLDLLFSPSQVDAIKNRLEEVDSSGMTYSDKWMYHSGTNRHDRAEFLTEFFAYLSDFPAKERAEFLRDFTHVEERILRTRILGAYSRRLESISDVIRPADNLDALTIDCSVNGLSTFEKSFPKVAGLINVIHGTEIIDPTKWNAIAYLFQYGSNPSYLRSPDVQKSILMNIETTIVYFIDLMFNGNVQKFNNWLIQMQKELFEEDSLPGVVQYVPYGDFIASRTNTRMLHPTEKFKRSLVYKDGALTFVKVDSGHEHHTLDIVSTIERVKRVCGNEVMLDDKNGKAAGHFRGLPILSASASYMDLFVLLLENGEYRGLLMEVLGFYHFQIPDENGHRGEYGLHKDRMAADYLASDLTPEYYAPTDALYKYYVTGVDPTDTSIPPDIFAYIGKQTPLYSDFQLQLKAQLLNLNPRLTFYELMHLTHDQIMAELELPDSIDPHDSAAWDVFKAEVIKLQQAYGVNDGNHELTFDQTIEIDGVSYTITTNMNEWWDNYEYSGQTWVLEILQRYQTLLQLGDDEIHA